MYNGIVLAELGKAPVDGTFCGRHLLWSVLEVANL